ELALRAQQVQALADRRVDARRRLEIGEQLRGRGAPRGLIELRERVGLQSGRPRRVRCREPCQVRLVQVAERRAPGRAGVPQLPGDVGELLRPLLELAERARAEDAEGVADAIEPADLGLPRRLVAPRLMEQL